MFLYGPLKAGEPDHTFLMDPKNGDAKFISLGHTEKKYPLIIATKFHMPFVLDSPGQGSFVTGEVYEINDTMLRKLDVLKDHPKLYEREREGILIKNKITDAFETHSCWVYFQKIVTPELLSRPSMSNYSSAGPHGLPYIRNNAVSTVDLKDV